MKTFKSLAIFFLSALLFFSSVANAGGFYFCPYTGRAKYVELPKEGDYKSFFSHVGQEIPLGRVKLDGNIISAPIEVKLFISSSLDWHLRFYMGKELKAYLYFAVEKNTSQFKGMLIQKSLRGKGLSKLLFKFYALFCKYYDLEMSTLKIYKPLFAKILMDLGYLPNDRTNEVWIVRDTGANLRVYPIDFAIEEHLIRSQQLIILDARPNEGSATPVFINTSFSLPNDLEPFWAHLEELRGEYYLFEPPAENISNITNSVNISFMVNRVMPQFEPSFPSFDFSDN